MQIFYIQIITLMYYLINTFSTAEGAQQFVDANFNQNYDNNEIDSNTEYIFKYKQICVSNTFNNIVLYIII